MGKGKTLNYASISAKSKRFIFCESDVLIIYALICDRFHVFELQKWAWTWYVPENEVGDPSLRHNYEWFPVFVNLGQRIRKEIALFQQSADEVAFRKHNLLLFSNHLRRQRKVELSICFWKGWSPSNVSHLRRSRNTTSRRCEEERCKCQMMKCFQGSGKRKREERSHDTAIRRMKRFPASTLFTLKFKKARICVALLY